MTGNNKMTFAVAFTENTNQSDEAISLMRKYVNETANECKIITGNCTTIIFANTNEIWLDDIVEEITKKVSCDVFHIDFSSEEAIYRNLPEVAKKIGGLLTTSLLTEMMVDVNLLDFKAIALCDYRRFYE